jgi:prolipoprotein diacylglyceryltransferase
VPLPPFVPLVGGLGTSPLALAALAGLLCAWAVVGRLLNRAARGGPGGEALVQAVGAAWLPGLAGALVGGRLANQVVAPDLRWDVPLTWLAVTGTSLSFAGALSGAALGAWWGMRALPAGARWAALDVLAPGAAAALAVGWLGLPAVGRQTGLPWGWPVGGGLAVHPVQLYGLVGFGALAALLGWQLPRRDFPGQNAVTFAVLAAALHFTLGFYAQTTPVLGPWSAAQLGDAAWVAAGLALTARLGADTAPGGGDGGG